jgi:hypothetical protein
MRAIAGMARSHSRPDHDIEAVSPAYYLQH